MQPNRCMHIDKLLVPNDSCPHLPQDPWFWTLFPTEELLLFLGLLANLEADDPNPAQEFASSALMRIERPVSEQRPKSIRRRNRWPRSGR